MGGVEEHKIKAIFDRYRKGVVRMERKGSFALMMTT